MVVQIAILVLSGAAIALLACEDKRVSQWGWVVGLVGQPFWIWETVRTGQWGMLLLSVWFGFHYARGAWHARRNDER